MRTFLRNVGISTTINVSPLQLSYKNKTILGGDALPTTVGVKNTAATAVFANKG
jgi:hypothetical protein